MPCETLQIEGSTAIICSRGRRKVKCHQCSSRSEFQCDFPMAKARNGKILKTCDRHLCSNHVRHGVTKGIDFCTEHFAIAKAAYERRQEKVNA